jgi:hypothetical protein
MTMPLGHRWWRISRYAVLREESHGQSSSADPPHPHHRILLPPLPGVVEAEGCAEAVWELQDEVLEDRS